MTSTRRASRLLVMTASGALALTGCASDNQPKSPAVTVTGAAGTPSGAATVCATGGLKGAGSTFQKNIVNQWIKDFGAACRGANIDYQGIGSGAGIKQFGAKTIDFAGSDSVMKADEQAAADARCGGKAIHLPITAGGIAVIYKLSGVSGLRLSPTTIAGIFQGTITKWNDPAVAADNAGVRLPATAITAVHRSDSSGTTSVFSKFLLATAPTSWTLGAGKELKWPAAVQGAKGSDGVTAAVAGSEGAVTYAEASYATSVGLSAAKIKNGAGQYAALDATSVATALAGASVPATGNDLQVTYNFANTTAGAYPITAVSYEILCATGNDPAKLPLLKAFLTYDIGTGQSSAAGLGFAPLPTAIVSRVTAAIGQLA